MSKDDCIVGIDLGTTNSEVAAFTGERVEVLGPGGTRMLPSCVGISPTGELLVGKAARNQQIIYPENTVRSIKRRMGTDEIVRLGDQKFSPQEISALILRELVAWAQQALGHPVKRAIITVPAYFSDAQRNATREAGELAGLEVVRILNEPTAASLAYGYGDDARRTLLVYDLGGGTFDVSIVSIEGDVTEVLASHGNNYLGGDDFDELLLDYLLKEFQKQHGFDLRDRHPAAYSRLRWAAEEAKRKLSFEPYATVREEALVNIGGKALHLEVELSRDEYEDMIRTRVESTLESVAKAMDDADKTAADVDGILLVGGSTRTPLVSQMLEERTGIIPRQDVHPDLCVALGAGVLASRLAGHEVNRVLVDVSPFSFGPSYLGERDGRVYPHCYHPIIHRNTPLPVTRTDNYYTSHPHQTVVDLYIYQGDNPDALKNILVGKFSIEGLTPTVEPNEVLCRMSLDIDGILHVMAIEKCTGKSRHITITDAVRPKNAEEIAEARKRLRELFATRLTSEDTVFVDATQNCRESIDSVPVSVPEVDGTPKTETKGEDTHIVQMDPNWAKAVKEARSLLERSRGMLERMHDEDKEEAIDLHEQIESSISSHEADTLSAAVGKLKELLFFIEGV